MVVATIYWGGAGGSFNPIAWIISGIGYIFYSGWNCEPLIVNGMQECGLF